MSSKVQTIWLVQAYNNANRPVGPTWEVPSKIKPVRWAQQAHKGYDYTFTYQDTGKTQREYDDEEFAKEQQAKTQEHTNV